MTVNLGPVSPTLDGVSRPTTGGGLLYNPRCLRRDISQYISSRWSTTSEILELILTKHDIASFQNHMQGDFAAGFLGVHSAGHFTIGGDPGGVSDFEQIPKNMAPDTNRCNRISSSLRVIPHSGCTTV